MRISLAIFIILLGISLLTYRNGLRGEFMHEDIAYLLSSSFRVPVNAMNDAFLPRADDNFYRPLTRIYDSWTYQRFGENMLPHRLINIICLTLTGVLVFLLVKNITSHTGTSLLASILFCVHPINSTPVLYVAMPVMPYATLFLLSMLCYTDFFERRQRWDLLLLSGLCFALSFLVHEIILCLPVYVFLYAWQLRGSGWRTAVLHTIPYLNQAHRWNPDSSAVHHNAAMSYFALGNAHRAEELLLRAQKFDPESTTVRDSLKKVRRYLESYE